jgi:uncharacterized protein YidB (DUF937 family)
VLCFWTLLLKAFDLIDHNILLSDLEKMGVRPALLSWLASYSDNSTNAEQVSMFIDDTTLSEVYNVTMIIGLINQLGTWNLISKGYQPFVANKEWHSM